MNFGKLVLQAEMGGLRLSCGNVAAFPFCNDLAAPAAEATRPSRCVSRWLSWRSMRSTPRTCVICTCSDFSGGIDFGEMGRAEALHQDGAADVDLPLCFFS